ncbi:hypothetical protein HK102_013191 [Quaeritorhiza haematococci]|nr:hypothetical protein HK102_013191 [Quaeritorhiza haematococci]
MPKIKVKEVISGLFHQQEDGKGSKGAGDSTASSSAGSSSKSILGSLSRRHRSNVSAEWVEHEDHHGLGSRRHGIPDAGGGSSVGVGDVAAMRRESMESNGTSGGSVGSLGEEGGVSRKGSSSSVSSSRNSNLDATSNHHTTINTPTTPSPTSHRRHPTNIGKALLNGAGAATNIFKKLNHKGNNNNPASSSPKSLPSDSDPPHHAQGSSDGTSFSFKTGVTFRAFGAISKSGGRQNPPAATTGVSTSADALVQAQTTVTIANVPAKHATIPLIPDSGAVSESASSEVLVASRDSPALPPPSTGTSISKSTQPKSEKEDDDGREDDRARSMQTKRDDVTTDENVAAPGVDSTPTASVEGRVLVGTEQPVGDLRGSNLGSRSVGGKGVLGLDTETGPVTGGEGDDGGQLTQMDDGNAGGVVMGGDRTVSIDAESGDLDLAVQTTSSNKGDRPLANARDDRSSLPTVRPNDNNGSTDSVSKNMILQTSLSALSKRGRTGSLDSTYQPGSARSGEDLLNASSSSSVGLESAGTGKSTKTSNKPLKFFRNRMGNIKPPELGLLNITGNLLRGAKSETMLHDSGPVSGESPHRTWDGEDSAEGKGTPDKRVFGFIHKLLGKNTTAVSPAELAGSPRLRDRKDEDGKGPIGRVFPHRKLDTASTMGAVMEAPPMSAPPEQAHFDSRFPMENTSENLSNARRSSLPDCRVQNGPGASAKTRHLNDFMKNQSASASSILDQRITNGKPPLYPDRNRGFAPLGVPLGKVVFHSNPNLLSSSSTSTMPPSKLRNRISAPLSMMALHEVSVSAENSKSNVNVNETLRNSIQRPRSSQSGASRGVDPARGIVSAEMASQMSLNNSQTDFRLFRNPAPAVSLPISFMGVRIENLPRVPIHFKIWLWCPQNGWYDSSRDIPLDNPHLRRRIRKNSRGEWTKFLQSDPVRQQQRRASLTPGASTNLSLQNVPTRMLADLYTMKAVDILDELLYLPHHHHDHQQSQHQPPPSLRRIAFYRRHRIRPLEDMMSLVVLDDFMRCRVLKKSDRVLMQPRTFVYDVLESAAEADGLNFPYEGLGKKKDAGVDLCGKVQINLAVVMRPALFAYLFTSWEPIFPTTHTDPHSPTIMSTFGTYTLKRDLHCTCTPHHLSNPPSAALLAPPLDLCTRLSPQPWYMTFLSLFALQTGLTLNVWRWWDVRMNWHMSYAHRCGNGTVGVGIVQFVLCVGLGIWICAGVAGYDKGSSEIMKGEKPVEEGKPELREEGVQSDVSTTVPRTPSSPPSPTFEIDRAQHPPSAPPSHPPPAPPPPTFTSQLPGGPHFSCNINTASIYWTWKRYWSANPSLAMAYTGPSYALPQHFRFVAIANDSGMGQEASALPTGKEVKGMVAGVGKAQGGGRSFVQIPKKDVECPRRWDELARKRKVYQRVQVLKTKKTVEGV